MRKLLVVFAMLVAMPSYAKSALIDLGTAQGGPVVLQGNVLNDNTFHFQAIVTIAGRDTVWNGLAINGLAVDDSMSITDTDEVTENLSPRQQLDDRVSQSRMVFLQSRRQMSAQPVARNELLHFLATEYAKDTTMVLRTTVVSDHEFLVCWKSNGICEHMVIGNEETLPTTEMLIVQRAASLRDKISEGRVLFISRGAMFAPRPSETLAFRQELSAIQHGKQPTDTFFPDRCFANDLRRPPMTVEMLRQEASR